MYNDTMTLCLLGRPETDFSPYHETIYTFQISLLI